MIRAVLLDFYDTLGYLESERVLDTRREIARRAGVDEAAFFDIWRRSFQARSLGQLGSLEQEFAAAFEELGVSLPGPAVQELASLERQAWHQAVRLYPDAEPALRELRRRGYRLALVSNCSAQAASAIRALDLESLADTLILSCEVGLLKPDPAIFLRACDALEVSPSECAFVGDGGSRELEAANRLGMYTLWLHRPGARDDLALDQPRHGELRSLGELPVALAAPSAAAPFDR